MIRISFAQKFTYDISYLAIQLLPVEKHISWSIIKICLLIKQSQGKGFYAKLKKFSEGMEYFAGFHEGIFRLGELS